MENDEIIRSIIEYVRKYIEEYKISQREVHEKCIAKGYKISQASISNMLNTPFSITLSTLLKVCNGLELNLLEIFNHTYCSQVGKNKRGKLIYNINDDAYIGYKNKFHVYFMPTTDNNGMLYHHAILHLEDLYNIGECNARLEFDTGEKKEDGSAFIKIYNGQFVISKMGCAYISLISDEYGDMWFLIINHGYINAKSLVCTIANAVTASSGRFRYPTVHRAILSREELNDNVLSYIRGFLFLSSNEIVISHKRFQDFLNDVTLSENVKEKLNSLCNISESFFSFSKDTLKGYLSDSEYVYVISMLISYSTAQKNNKVTDVEDDQIFKIVNDFIKRNK